MSVAPFKVGLLYLNSNFGEELLTKLNELPPFSDKKGNKIQICAEHIPIKEVEVHAPIPYQLIIDRASYLLKQMVGILMGYSFRGIPIVNNPFSFHYFLEQKDAGYSLASSLGILIPKTYILPTHQTPQLTLEDFQYHQEFDWETMLKEISFPCIIKPAGGRAGKEVNIANDFEALIDFYHQSETKVMMLQEKVKSPYNWQLRCLCIGNEIIICKYQFRKKDQSRYLEDSGFLTKQQEQKIIQDCRILNRIHGYEMNSVEFILDEEGKPWAIDFNNPIPDGRKKALGPYFYQRYQQAMVHLVQKIAWQAKPSSFLPELNAYSQIAQSKDSTEEKYNRALKLANKYYEEPSFEKN